MDDQFPKINSVFYIIFGGFSDGDWFFFCAIIAADLIVNMNMVESPYSRVIQSIISYNIRACMCLRTVANLRCLSTQSKERPKDVLSDDRRKMVLC